ncbi:MAG: hypothetical protein H7A36_01140 [Chlamydiales bacterium]|nr:hypothetical protein [Chlamydiales bacterium]
MDTVPSYIAFAQIAYVPVCLECGQTEERVDVCARCHIATHCAGCSHACKPSSFQVSPSGLYGWIAGDIHREEPKQKGLIMHYRGKEFQNARWVSTTQLSSSCVHKMMKRVMDSYCKEEGRVCVLVTGRSEKAQLLVLQARR